MKNVIIFILLVFVFEISFAAQERLNLVDRLYVSKLLKNVFGVKSRMIVKENISKKGNVFGGPCDIYEHSRVEADVFVGVGGVDCENGKQEFIIPSHVKATVLREALMLKACTELVSDPITLKYVEDTWFLTAPSIDEKINKISSLFHFRESSRLRLVDNLKKISAKYKNEKQTKMIILHACIDPTWHII